MAEGKAMKSPLLFSPLLLSYCWRHKRCKSSLPFPLLSEAGGDKEELLCLLCFPVVRQDGEYKKWPIAVFLSSTTSCLSVQLECEDEDWRMRC